MVQGIYLICIYNYNLDINEFTKTNPTPLIISILNVRLLVLTCVDYYTYLHYTLQKKWHKNK